MTEDLFQIRDRSVKRHPSKKATVAWQVYIPGGAGDQDTVIAEHPTEAKAENHAARLNAANAPPKPVGPFAVTGVEDSDGEDRYEVRIVGDIGHGTGPAFGSHDESRCRRLADLLNQLVSDFQEGIVG